MPFLGYSPKKKSGGEGFLGAEVDGVGAAAEFLRGQVDVFAEGFADAFVDRVLDLDPIHHLGGLGVAGEVAGESGAGQSGEASKAVVKEAAAGNLGEMGILHGFDFGRWRKGGNVLFGEGFQLSPVLAGC